MKRHFNYLIWQDNSGLYNLALYAGELSTVSRYKFQTYAKALKALQLMQLPLTEYDQENMKYIDRYEQETNNAA